MDKLRAFFAPNRVAVYLTVIGGCATAATAVLQNADTSTTVGLVVAYAGAVQAVVKWLDGWQKDEQRQHDALQGVETAELPPAKPTDVPLREAA